MQVEERWPCPRCGNRRTQLWAAGRYHCFNCKHQWQLVSRRSEPARNTELTTVFTPDELQRLRIYRAAVQAGFYTDSLNVLSRT